MMRVVGFALLMMPIGCTTFERARADGCEIILMKENSRASDYARETHENIINALDIAGEVELSSGVVVDNEIIKLRHNADNTLTGFERYSDEIFEAYAARPCDYDPDKVAEKLQRSYEIMMELRKLAILVSDDSNEDDQLLFHLLSKMTSTLDILREIGGDFENHASSEYREPLCDEYSDDILLETSNVRIREHFLFNVGSDAGGAMFVMFEGLDPRYEYWVRPGVVRHILSQEEQRRLEELLRNEPHSGSSVGVAPYDSNHFAWRIYRGFTRPQQANSTSRPEYRYVSESEGAAMIPLRDHLIEDRSLRYDRIEVLSVEIRAIPFSCTGYDYFELYPDMDVRFFVEFENPFVLYVRAAG